MARRARGCGAVYLRGDGRWEAQYRMADGRRKCLYGRTRREVKGGKSRSEFNQHGHTHGADLSLPIAS